MSRNHVKESLEVIINKAIKQIHDLTDKISQAINDEGGVERDGDDPTTVMRRAEHIKDSLDRIWKTINQRDGEPEVVDLFVRLCRNCRRLVDNEDNIQEGDELDEAIDGLLANTHMEIEGEPEGGKGLKNGGGSK
jgi:hypothetical protein